MEFLGSVAICITSLAGARTVPFSSKTQKPHYVHTKSPNLLLLPQVNTWGRSSIFGNV